LSLLTIYFSSNEIPNKISNYAISSPIPFMLLAAIEFILPTFVDTKKGCVYFQSAAAWMVGTVNLETVTIIWATRDIKDHGVVEKVGAGEADAVVAVGLGEMRFVFVIVGM